jgi:hypothetical protein
MVPTLNSYQMTQLREYITRHAADSDLVESWGWERHPEIQDLRWFPCKVPGMVAVHDENGYVCKLLYPEPRPVNNDPLFQHAGPVTRMEWVIIPKIIGRREYWDDWQWRDALAMDAPREMPAGACEWMDAGDDAYGANQMTCSRE